MKNKRLFINLISSIVSFAISLGISFIITPIIVNRVGDAAYGFVGLANNFVSYASILTIVINSMANRFITYELTKKNIEKANKYYSSVFFMNLIISVVILIISVIIVLNINILLKVPDNLILDVKITFLLAFINMILSLFVSVYNIASFAKNRIDLISIRNIIGNILKAAILILLFFTFQAKIYFIMLATIIMSIYLLVSNYKISKKVAPELSIKFKDFDSESVKILSKSGIWNSINSLSKTLLTGLDLLIANIFIDPVSMGILSIAKTVPNSIENLLAVFANTFNPEFVILYSRNKINDLIKHVNFSLKVVGFIMIVPLAAYMVFGYDFFKLWLPLKQHEELIKIQILSILSVAPFIISSCNYTLFVLDSVTNQLKRPVIATLVMSIMSTIITIALVTCTDLGIYAVAGVSSILWIIKVITFNIINAAKNLNIKWYTFYKPFFQNIITLIALVCLFLTLKNMIFITNWTNFFMYMFLIALLGYIISYFLIFNHEEKNTLINKLSNKIFKKTNI